MNLIERIESPEHPVRMERADGTTLQEMRANLSADFRAKGDCFLAWVNEGDILAAALRSIGDAHDDT